jgi:hypothetical protein
MATASAGGAKFFVTVLDDYTGFKAVQPIAKKSSAPDFVKTVIQNWEAKTGLKTVAIRHDRAKEYMAAELQDWYNKQGIESQPTSGYSPQENSAAERLNRTLWETTLAMLADSGLPAKWWAEALSHACYLKKVTSTGDKTPWELIKGETPDLNTLRVFGSPCMVKIPDERRHKLQMKTEPGKLLGFDLPNMKAYRVLTTGGKVIPNRDITADEDFESKATTYMLDFEDEAGITPTPAPPSPLAAPPASPAPPAPADTSVPEDPPDGEKEDPADPGTSDPHAAGDKAAAPRTSQRDKKGMPPARYQPSLFRLVRSGPLAT